MAECFYRVLGQEFGPISLESLRNKILSGELSVADEFRSWDEISWTCIAEFHAQELSRHTTPTLTAHSMLSWDGGHDDVEVFETVSNEPVAKPVEQRFIQRSCVESAASLSEKPATPDALDTCMHWYVRTGQVERGPLKFQKLIDLAASGYILPTDRVREGDKSEWKIARTIPGLFTTNHRSFPIVMPSASTGATRPLPFPSAIPSYAQQTARFPVSSIPAAFAQPKPQQPLLNLGIVSSKEAPQRTSISSSKQPVEFSQRIVEFDSEIHQSHPEENAPAEVHSSLEQSIRHPQQQLDGESKHKLRRGHFQEPQLPSDSKLKLAACIGLVVLLLYITMVMNRVTVADFEGPYRELEKNYTVLSTEWSEKPSMEFWMVATEKLEFKFDSILRKIKNLNSKQRERHAVSVLLVAAANSMIEAVKSNSINDVALHLQQAREILDLSRKELKPEAEVRKATTGQY